MVPGFDSVTDSVMIASERLSYGVNIVIRPGCCSIYFVECSGRLALQQECPSGSLCHGHAHESTNEIAQDYIKPCLPLHAMSMERPGCS